MAGPPTSSLPLGMSCGLIPSTLFPLYRINIQSKSCAKGDLVVLGAKCVCIRANVALGRRKDVRRVQKIEQELVVWWVETRHLPRGCCLVSGLFLLNLYFILRLVAQVVVCYLFS